MNYTYNFVTLYLLLTLTPILFIELAMAFAFALTQTLFSLLLLLPIYSTVAQTNGAITLGASLSATDNSSWLSPSGDFAFGFCQLNNTNLFLLSIWYAKIPEKTVVWYASETLAPRGSQVNLTADNGLVLTSPQGQQLWNSSSPNVASGVMNDTGNFVLKDSNSNEVWSSFNNPTDTILPTQTMENEGSLFSRQSETNFSKGRFQVRFLDGNLVLNTINLPSTYANDPPYYKNGTIGDNNNPSPGIQLALNESGYMYIVRENKKRFVLGEGVVNSQTDYYYRATLDFDGVFTLYSHPKTSIGSWTVVWSVPENICTDIFLEKGGIGACGFNSICTLKDSRPTCRCPPGYSLIDPNDQYSSCKVDFIQGCEEDKLSSTKDIYSVEELTYTDWPTSDYLRLEPFTEVDCRNSCLQDCICAVAIFTENKTCWKKKLPLSNGRYDGKFSGKAFIKVRKSTIPGSYLPNPNNTPDRKKKNQDGLIIPGSVLLGSSVFVNFILIGAFCYGFFFIYQKKRNKINRGSSVLDINLHCFTYKELQDATNGFMEELGKGAFGIVYKGAIQMGSNIPVAVKKLYNFAQDSDKEFKAELIIIGKTHHKNLVRLIGFCEEGQQRLLVYEFLGNGTLADFLFGDLRPNWKQRIQIAFGIARGLLYLHEECSNQIIHCDIKPQNMLLDKYYEARISDFGLAKLLMMGQSHTNTAIRGTKGYVAPEWFRNMPVTAKVDVYSFGVMLLEIICCRRSVDMASGREETAILTDWAYDCFREGTLDALVEHDIEALEDREKLERFVMIAIWCIQEDPSLRPTIRKVMQMLEGVVDVPVPPSPSPFTTATSL